MTRFFLRVTLASAVVLIASATAAENAKEAPQQTSPKAGKTKATSPVPRFQAKPQYPMEMRRQGISGEVVVDFIVTENGDVANARAVRSSRQEFEAAAVEAVSKWKFKPGTKDGRPVATHMQTPIVFALNAPAATKKQGP